MVYLSGSVQISGIVKLIRGDGRSFEWGEYHIPQKAHLLYTPLGMCVCKMKEFIHVSFRDVVAKTARLLL